ncbi:uncharacterized protein EI90DRAFT_1755072 [Cantharellus anzutake]|uniref:uncharacterized protein n=1 Tax=Cantharellus anzutake TaxID=1750568 RepID=UPI001907CF23|nr:uncharacterized protein EI90DRAFT_1755072 [Cantharellus anzutake]KAF8341569.1 hypothetical protein EI90DRAFT_1755072 [Cantharellus anzutake]
MSATSNTASPSRSSGGLVTREDVVSDSEPERAQARRRRKEERAKAKATASQLYNCVATDDRNASQHVAQQATKEPPIPAVSIEPFHTDISCAPTPPSPSTNQLMQSISPYTSPEQVRTISFEEFALRRIPSRSGTTRSTNKASPFLREISTKVTARTNPPPGKQMPAGPKKPTARKNGTALPLLDISDDDWRKLHLCFSCGIRWTRQKTVNKKKEHIGKCVKSYEIARDTIEALIRQTLEGVPVPKVPEAEPQHSPILHAGTLLSDCVSAREAQRRRTRCSGEALSSIKNLARAKDGIRKRAEEFLSAHAISSDFPPTQALAPSALGEFPSTSGPKLAEAATSSSPAWLSVQMLPSPPPNSSLTMVEDNSTSTSGDANLSATQKLPPSCCRQARTSLSTGTESESVEIICYTRNDSPHPLSLGLTETPSPTHNIVSRLVHPIPSS